MGFGKVKCIIIRGERGSDIRHNPFWYARYKKYENREGKKVHNARGMKVRTRQGREDSQTSSFRCFQ